MSELRRYSDYKDSGVPWLGEIPSHWEAKAIKRISRIHRGASPRPIADSKYFDDEGEYAWVRIADVTASDDYLLETTQRLSELGASLSVKMQPDQIFLSIAGSVGKPIITKIKACIHDGFVYFPDWDQSTRFLYYIFASGKPYLGLGKLGTQLNLNTETVGSIKIGIPNLEEQQAIVNFLDTELEHIDTLIYRQQQLIEKLAEQRSAVITHAVTKGLDPDVPMKDSGVESIGDIPDHWHLTYNKYLFNFSRGLTITKADLIDEGIPCVSYGEVHSKYGFEVDPNIHPLKCVPESYAENFKYAVLKEGDFVFADTSEDYKGSGNFTHLNSKTLTMAGYHTVVMKQKHDHNHRYLAYMFDSQAFRIQVINRVSGVKVFSVTQGILKRTPAWLPPRTEQNKIVIYLDKETQKIDQMSEATKGIIAKLQEYRSALITQAVTGKIDVRHINKKAS